MDTWMKIGSALLIGMMLIIIFPRVKQSLKDSPKASGDDWRSALIPLLLVIGFVVLLIMLVR